MTEKKSFKAVLTPTRKDYENYCICRRFASDVFCENAQCTFSGHGRVQTPCKFHPMETYYLELTQCPRCDSKCLEIFIPSVVTEDSRYRREPHQEELKDCYAHVIIPYVSYEQQPYIKEQEMLNDLYSQKLSREAYMIWRETMQRRCFIVKKKHQLLVEQEALLSRDSNKYVPKITMEDLEKMRDHLYEAGKLEKQWRRSAAPSQPPPILPKFQEIEVKPLPSLPIQRSPSKVQMRLMNISKERDPTNPSKAQMRLMNISKGPTKPSKVQMKLKHVSQEHGPTKRTPQKNEMYQKPASTYSWYNPLYASSKPAFSPPCNLQKKLLVQSQFKESMDAIQKGLEAQSLHGAAPHRFSQAKPQTVQKWPPNNTPNVFYYQSQEGQQKLDKFSSTFQDRK